MILYFSATGNSEYIAKNIAYLNNDEVVNMSDYLRKGEAMNLTSEKPYVVISPVYISTLPVIVLDLLKKSKLEGNKNIYFIMTCAGSGISGAGAFVKPLELEGEQPNVIRKTKKVYLTQKQLDEATATFNTGDYQYDVPFGASKNDPTLSREPGFSMKRLK